MNKLQAKKFGALILLLLYFFNSSTGAIVFATEGSSSLPPADSCSFDTSNLEAKIDALSVQTSALSERVDSVESTVRTQENRTRTSISDVLLKHFPVVLIEKTFNVLTFGILGFGTDVDIFNLYKSLYIAKPELSPLYGPVDSLSKLLLEVYIIVIVLYSIWLLYSGAMGRVVLKENFARILIGALLLRSAFWVYNVLVNITTGITQLFVNYISFELLSLNLKTFLLSIDVITIFLVFFIILGLVLGGLAYVTTFFGALVSPLILLLLSMPWERVRSVGESLASGMVGILLAPALSASILAVIPFALQSTSGLESIVINRAVMLGGLLLAIIFPTFLIISLILKPVVKVAVFTKLTKMVVK